MLHLFIVTISPTIKKRKKKSGNLCVQTISIFYIAIEKRNKRIKWDPVFHSFFNSDNQKKKKKTPYLISIIQQVM